MTQKLIDELAAFVRSCNVDTYGEFSFDTELFDLALEALAKYRQHQPRTEGLEADLNELIRVALTNPADLNGFIQANYPKQFAKHEPRTEQQRDCRWHHGGGYLCMGTLRIAKADFDTNPSDEYKAEIFDHICNTLNATSPQKQVSGDVLMGIKQAEELLVYDGYTSPQATAKGILRNLIIRLQTQPREE